MIWKVKYVYTTAPCKLYTDIYGDDRKRERELWETETGDDRERALRDRETGDERERDVYTTAPCRSLHLYKW